ncbi:MAG: glycosyltransferase family 1 protein [bacterium]
MARIGVDARYLENDLTGLGRYSFNLLAHLLELDRSNQYRVFLRNDYRGPLPRSDRVRYLPVPYLPISPGSLVGMSLQLRKAGVDLWHAHFPVLPLAHGPPAVITVHDLQPLRVPALAGRRPLPLRLAYRAFYSLVYRRSVLRSLAVIAVSQATSLDLQACFGTPPEKIRVIEEALDPRFVGSEGAADPPEQANGSPQTALPERFLLYVGATLPHKNIDTMLRAFARALKRPGVGDCHLVLAGRESRFDRDWMALAEELGLERRIVRLGYVRQDGLPRLYRRARALLHVARYEGFGFPPLEALHCGLPPIVARHASLPEVVGPAGLWVDPDDADGMAEAIERILVDNGLRRRILACGKQVLERYSWGRAARSTLDLYEQLLRDSCG